MNKNKENIYQDLLVKGRILVCEKGADFLTARKLSETSGYSIGTIYNQFANMDEYILVQNIQTLEELYNQFQLYIPQSNAYVNLNRYLEIFIDFVSTHQNLWFLLFNFHLQNKRKIKSYIYNKKVCQIILIWQKEFEKAFYKLSKAERKISLQTLWVSLFSISSFLTQKQNSIEQKKLCQILLNTYLAGLSRLKNR